MSVVKKMKETIIRAINDGDVYHKDDRMMMRFNEISSHDSTEEFELCDLGGTQAPTHHN